MEAGYVVKTDQPASPLVARTEGAWSRLTGENDGCETIDARPAECTIEPSRFSSTTRRRICIVNLRVKRKNVAFVGLLSAGKSVLLTAIINHLRNHDPDVVPLGATRGALSLLREELLDGGIKAFPYTQNRDLLGNGRWIAKTLELQGYRARIARTDWRVTQLDLTFCGPVRAPRTDRRRGRDVCPPQLLMPIRCLSGNIG